MSGTFSNDKPANYDLADDGIDAEGVLNLDNSTVTVEERPPRLRELLEVASSPDPRHDYLVVYQGQIGSNTTVTIRFVPDRLVLIPLSLATYFNMRDGHMGAEALALAILDDLNNELVPRWIEITVLREYPLLHRVVITDQQPDWAGTLPAQ